MSPWPFEAPHRDPPRVSPCNSPHKTTRALNPTPGDSPGTVVLPRLPSQLDLQHQEQPARLRPLSCVLGGGGPARPTLLRLGGSARTAGRYPPTITSGIWAACRLERSEGLPAQGSGVATPGWWRMRATRTCCCRTARWRASRRSCTRSTARAMRACRCAPTDAHSGQHLSVE